MLVKSNLSLVSRAEDRHSGDVAVIPASWVTWDVWTLGLGPVWFQQGANGISWSKKRGFCQLQWPRAPKLSFCVRWASSLTSLWLEGGSPYFKDDSEFLHVIYPFSNNLSVIIFLFYSLACCLVCSPWTPYRQSSSLCRTRLLCMCFVNPDSQCFILYLECWWVTQQCLWRRCPLNNRYKSMPIH